MVNKLIAWIVAGIGISVWYFLVEDGVAFLSGWGDMMWLFAVIYIGMNASTGGDLMGNITNGLQNNLMTYVFFFVAAAVGVLIHIVAAGMAFDIMMIVKGGLAAAVSGIVTTVWWGAVKAGA